MLVKTAELIDLPLEWAAAKCEGGQDFLFDGLVWGFTLLGKSKVLAGKAWAESMRFTPSTDWAQGGPIIEREISLVQKWIAMTGDSSDFWEARITPLDEDLPETRAFGPTLLIAAMRCYVMSKLGEYVDIPKELI